MSATCSLPTCFSHLIERALYTRAETKVCTNHPHVVCASHLKARFHYERGKEHSLFVLLIFFALASILTARFNRRSIKETKNALFHARSGNGPQRSQVFYTTSKFLGSFPL